MVLLVHGGPWWRDPFGFDGLVQLLANRGYAVLQVEFRGSTGYGKRFLNAGNQQWGLSMQDDLTDAVAGRCSRASPTPSAVAIMGGSYGGYATLAGARLHPRALPLRSGPGGPVEPLHPARHHSAVLGDRAGELQQAHRRPRRRSRQGAAHPGLAALLGAEDSQSPLLIGQGRTTRG